MNLMLASKIIDFALITLEMIAIKPEQAIHFFDFISDLKNSLELERRIYLTTLFLSIIIYLNLDNSQKSAEGQVGSDFV